MIEQDVTIAFNKRITPSTFLMGLESPEIVAEARPGQFLMIRVRSGMDPLLRRPFSISGIQDNDLFLILYQVVGRGTALMSMARGGERLSVLGPLGRGFRLPTSGRKSFIVAGGIGVAPLLFLSGIIGPHDSILMAGYVSASEIVPLEKAGLAGMDMSIATDDGTAGHKGPVTELLETHLSESGHTNPTVFACGPIPMLRRVAALTMAMNVPCQVSIETSMACGLGACQGCAVAAASQENRPFYYVCRDGPVFDAQVLDWGLL